MKTVLKQDTSYTLEPSRLKEGSVFGALSERSITYLLKNGALIELESGDQLFDYGDKGDRFYVVLEGCLDFYKTHNDQTCHTRSINFGEAVGFVSMIALHDKVGKAIAKENSLVLEVTSQLFSDFHDDYAFDFGILLMNLSRDMARSLRELGNALVENHVSIKA
ncbi:Cyclic nucleotide-binding domain protein [Marinomonas spartinae]|uniref:Cyclic nucleotide-binding domain protein n=1 Tax=Marinomonas spartinae TaxID=1792290 RepID=A0A1A8TKU9_9GAMM|nr:cyclic nucleotide-binding domain-containing protein [Marinomonas spartinae]SBS34474.1 Cyclic nucleotide-binding domain protein [Marinomonas spartinae]SBS38118.1 Cyclic nucleotide-binding domain protein [Marinomonas spartinae]